MDLKKTEDEEGKTMILQQQLEDAQNKNFEFALTIEELSMVIDCLKRKIFEVEGKVREREEGFLRRIEDGICEREELVGKINLGMRENKRLLMENEVFKGKNEEFEKNLLRGLSVVCLIKECLMRVYDEKDMENMKETMSNFEGEMKDCWGMEDFIRELNFVLKMVRRVEEVLGAYGGKEVLFREIRVYKRRIKELEESLMKGFKVLDLIKDSLVRINEFLDEKKVQFELDHECEDLEEKLLNFDDSKGSVEVIHSYFEKLEIVITMAKRVEDKMNDYQEKVKKEKKELERNVMSLTEENRDFSSLLRIALIEKEAVEKSLRQLKDSNEQRRGPLLQFAERGLQRVGFGFIVGGASNEQCKDQNKTSDQISDGVVSDASSEYEEEVVDLASTMEKMIKNTRLEIAQLRIELEESRSDTERLQRLTEKQTHQIHELTVYINELEDRERILTRNVEELNIELKETEAEADRWRQACEMEVEAGKCIAQEHNKLVDILKHELEKTRAALQVSDKRLKSKEEVAAAAMAAQVAAERSLQLADRRCAGLHQRIEDLTRQIDEVENREKHRKHRRRRVCWPWQALYPANTASNVRRVLPEMQAFLR